MPRTPEGHVKEILPPLPQSEVLWIVADALSCEVYCEVALPSGRKIMSDSNWKRYVDELWEKGSPYELFLGQDRVSVHKRGIGTKVWRFADE